MKLMRFMPILALACVCVAGQADAACDTLMMREQAPLPLTNIEQEVVLPVPSEEVRDVVRDFTHFQLSHRYKEDSYARVALDRLYNDYKKFFESHTTVSEAGRMDYAQEIIDILDRNTAGIKNDELRFYMNEMVIFSLKQSMKDGNNRVKVVQQTNELAAEGDRVVNLRKAINTEEALD